MRREESLPFCYNENIRETIHLWDYGIGKRKAMASFYDMFEWKLLNKQGDSGPKNSRRTSVFQHTTISFLLPRLSLMSLCHVHNSSDLKEVDIIICLCRRKLKRHHLDMKMKF